MDNEQCPFCGNKSISVVQALNVYRCFCHICGAHGPHSQHHKPEQALENWNMRAPIEED